MKKLNYLFYLTLLTITFSMEAQNYSKISENSKIEWEGTKPAGSHNGTIKLQSANVTLGKEKNINTGEFIIDMNSINCTDLEGEWKTKLETHLKSQDFFDVEKYKISKFVIKTINPNKTDRKYNSVIEGDLTIKDITHSITFKAIISYENDNITMISDIIKIDRTKWNVKYNSGKFFDNLKDKLINDEMSVNFSLELKK